MEVDTVGGPGFAPAARDAAGCCADPDVLPDFIAGSCSSVRVVKVGDGSGFGR